MARVNIEALRQELQIDKVAEALGMELRDEAPDRKKALCPFHDDRSPSLLIDASRNRGPQHFHCYACGAHGDAIDLVKGKLNLDFKQSIEWLTSNFRTNQGTKLSPRSLTKVALVDQSGLEHGYSIYQACNNSANLALWANERRLDVKSIERANCSYAIKNTLSDYLVTSPTESRREVSGFLEDAHLIRKVLPEIGSSYHLNLNSEPRYTDAFTGDRIVFPIKNERKQLVGFAARAAGDPTQSAQPKYLLTQGFNKSDVLYRADCAFEKLKLDAKKTPDGLRLYICEGFLDALRLESLGFAAVAAMGISLSNVQVQLLKVLRDALPPTPRPLTICLCFDRDEAGLRGSAKVVLQLLDAGLDAAFVWPTAEQLQAIHANGEIGKDPDEYLAGLKIKSATKLLHESQHPPGVAVLGKEFGANADEVLFDAHWNNGTHSRKHRAYEKSLAALRKISTNTSQIRQWIEGSGEQTSSLVAVHDWLATLDAKTYESTTASELYLTNADARLNHARLLAYMSSRRGELPCDEPRWERLDVAATAFNFVLQEKMKICPGIPVGPFEAVWVPRSFGGKEHRLKVMPQPEDLTIQQYLLNELLTERWDRESLGSRTFSHCIPAVRYYREERKTITTGLSQDIDKPKDWVLDDHTLSFAYQVDMEVLEGRQPATDQGMFRPFHECWRDFMDSIKKQANEIGYVHFIRLDICRYYDRLRRTVVRDSMQSNIKAALETIDDATPQFSELLRFGALEAEATDKAASIVEMLNELVFGYKYLRPDTGHVDQNPANIGIPQGPVLSAWIGSIALFPVDRAARALMERHNANGQVRIGYARYVDDIVLLADSAALLEELREVVDRSTKALDLALVAKADAVPPMSASEFEEYVSQGRAMYASGPAWEPPLMGDGQASWEFWSSTPATDRQSALQLLSNWEIYKGSCGDVMQVVKTAFLAADLRATELAKGARLIWYAVAADFESNSDTPLTAGSAWDRFDEFWTTCVSEAEWELNPISFSWESPILFALEGLEKLIDHKGGYQPGLNATENERRQKRIASLAKIAVTKEFSQRVTAVSSTPQHQTKRRLKLLEWKAAKACGQPVMRLGEAQSAIPVKEWEPFEWFHGAVEQLMMADKVDTDPMFPYVNPFQNSRTSNNQSFPNSRQMFGLLMPEPEASQPASDAANDLKRIDSNVAGIAVQSLIALVPESKILEVLSRRRHLLGQDNHRKYLMMPPLPGINQKRLLACEILDRTSGNLCSLGALESYEVVHGPASAPPNYLGIDSKDNVVNLSPNWQSADSPASKLIRLRAPIPAGVQLQLLARPQVQARFNDTNRLKDAAKLYRAIFLVMSEYEKQNPGFELVPAWPYVATDETAKMHFLLCEGVSRDEVDTFAFVRDGGRALRTIKVSMYEARLWRIGVAITDYLGLHDDISKFSSSEVDVPLDAIAFSEPATYVLRNQLRKLRGAFANSETGTRLRGNSGLPASVERALELLEQFPTTAGSADLPLQHLIATESETAAMRLRYEERGQSNSLTSFLRRVSNRMLAKLPLTIGEAFASQPKDVNDLRRDLAGVVTLARNVFAMECGSQPTHAWRAVRAGLVSTGIASALQGVSASLRSHGGFAKYEGFDFPIEWGIATAPPSSSTEDSPPTQQGQRGVSEIQEKKPLLELLRLLVQQLGYRLRLDEDGQPQISEHVGAQLKDVALALSEADRIDTADLDESDWPFWGLNERVFGLLDLQLLERVCDLVRSLDRELGFRVVLVEEQSYGYNAQTQRFTDSRSRVWDIEPWMISQFPGHARHIEECKKDRRVLRVWSEVHDVSTDRLLSIAVLGEPFASIAISRDDSNHTASPVGNTDTKIQSIGQLVNGVAPSSKNFESLASGRPTENSEPINAAPIKESGIERRHSRFDNGTSSTNIEHKHSRAGDDSSYAKSARSFRDEVQSTGWEKRKDMKNPAHVRVAILQWHLEPSFKHPIVETNPLNWPLGKTGKEFAEKNLKSTKRHQAYSEILKATAKSGSEHYWNNEHADLPSWAEHRRRKFLERAINACEAFGVELLVLPEYSVRPETVEWLKEILVKKKVAVLAGTYMEFRANASKPALSAQLNLLWPLPKDFAPMLSELPSLSTEEKKDGYVLQWTRGKKYRSIGLNEFIRPDDGDLKALFQPRDIEQKLRDDHKRKLSVEGVIKLLADTELPLAHLLELVCSEVFLVTSPANVGQMAHDLAALLGRFEHGNGFEAIEENVWNDLKRLAKLLSVCTSSNGVDSRRSILVIPAATTRTADYWIAGQSALLSGGTTTVFCNGTGTGLQGGSCFIGRESWKNGDAANGYISAITPYHGWSKGIYYNSKHDPLGSNDQALVIADIDPHNMLEGKPRPQMLPVPLQLVAYLPIAELVDSSSLDQNLCEAIGIDVSKLKGDRVGEDLPGGLKEYSDFWRLVTDGHLTTNKELISKFSEYFADSSTVKKRVEAFWINHLQQPFNPEGRIGVTSSPVFYDWLDVNLTMESGKKLPLIAVPPWTDYKGG
jgi:DNA primase catalytic core